jgi:riboflavin kinase/FMN adenylyltransferase
MEIIEQYHNNGQETSPTVIALGYFDGIHLGHQKLIKTTKKIAVGMNIKSAVYTFKTHPLSILSPEKVPKLLFSNNKKIKIFKSLGIDYLIFPDFTRELMITTPEEFVKNILVDKFDVKHVVIGFNYRFGYKELGTPDILIKLGKKYGFDVTIIEPVKVKDTTISSTNIRKLIQAGDMQTAKVFLGSYYSISGKVVQGKGLGKKLSMPTANIEIDKTIALPKNGVYKTIVQYDNKKYRAVTNIGSNPTFINHPYTIESYILNFNKEIYDEEIEIFFIERIRAEKKFNSLDDLVSQVQKDIEFVKRKE